MKKQAWYEEVKALIKIVGIFCLLGLLLSSCTPAISAEEYDRVCAELESSIEEISSLNSELADLEALHDELKIKYDELSAQYEEMSHAYHQLEGTLGGVEIFLYSTSRAILSNNENATNPTLAALKGFLENDNTDRKEYIEGSFVCKDFAQMLHNNAEEKGIRAAFVHIDFEGEDIGHALNAFYTTDIGLVYIDCTQGDTVAYIEVGKEYGLVDLAVVQSFTYDSYVDYKEQKKEYDDSLKAYNAAVEEYSAKVEEYNRHPSKELFDQLQQEYEELDAWLAELHEWISRLGIFWESLGIVEKVEIYW